jgi:hypothetical protein
MIIYGTKPCENRPLSVTHLVIIYGRPQPGHGAGLTLVQTPSTMRAWNDLEAPGGLDLDFPNRPEWP